MKESKSRWTTPVWTPGGYALVVLVAARVIFFVLNHRDLPAANNFREWTWILLYALRSDLLVSILLLLPALVAEWIITVTNSRFLKWMAVAFYTLSVVLIAAGSISDAVYFAGSHRRLTQADLGVAADNAGLFIPYSVKYWYLLLTVFAFAVVGWKLAASYFTTAQSGLRSRRKLITASLVSILVLCILGFDFRSRHFFTPSSGYFVMKAENVPFSANTVTELIASSKYDGIEPGNWRFMDAGTAYALHPVIKNVPAVDRPGKNIILFIIESASREDFTEGPARTRTMPFLDSLMKRSLVFDNFFANALSSPPGFDAIMGGLPEGFAGDFFLTGYGYNKTQWFTEILKQRGYNTNFFYGVKDFSYSFLKASKSYGLDHDFGYRHYAGSKNDFDGYYGIYDHIFFPAVAAQHATIPQPFLSVIYNVSTHMPFTLIPKAILDTLPAFTKSNGRSLRYYDNVMRNFFAVVKQQPWFANSTFLFVADHFSRATDLDRQSAADIYKIPMFIYSPDDRFVGHSSQLGQQIDLPATIVSLAGGVPRFFTYGKPLLDSREAPEMVYNLDGALLEAMDSCRLLQYNMVTRKIKGYYNYVADPHLSTDLYGQRSKEADSVLQHLLAFWQVYAMTLHDNRMHPDSFPNK